MEPKIEIQLSLVQYLVFSQVSFGLSTPTFYIDLESKAVLCTPKPALSSPGKIKYTEKQDFKTASNLFNVKHFCYNCHWLKNNMGGGRKNEMKQIM